IVCGDFGSVNEKANVSAFHARQAWCERETARDVYGFFVVPLASPAILGDGHIPKSRRWTMSKHRRVTLMITSWLAVMIGSSLAYDAEKRDAAQEEQKKLEGTWLMVSGEQDGKPVAADVVKAGRLIIQADRHTVKVGKDTFVGTHKLDPLKTPKTIDSTDTEGPFKDKTILGIYEATEDTFRVCFAPPDKERPKEFTTKSGTATILHVWKKQKEKE